MRWPSGDRSASSARRLSRWSSTIRICTGSCAYTSHLPTCARSAARQTRKQSRFLTQQAVVSPAGANMCSGLDSIPGDGGPEDADSWKLIQIGQRSHGSMTSTHFNELRSDSPTTHASSNLSKKFCRGRRAHEPRPATARIHAGIMPAYLNAQVSEKTSAERPFGRAADLTPPPNRRGTLHTRVPPCIGSCAYMTGSSTRLHGRQESSTTRLVRRWCMVCDAEQELVEPTVTD